MRKNVVLTILTLLVLPLIVSAQTTDSVVKGVTAHRGNSIAFPENTLLAFQEGINAHADWVELDIRQTKDGQIVISHDADTKRTTGVELRIPETTYAELQKLDVATGFRESHHLSLEQCPVQHMPLLKDALALFAKQSKTHVSMHLKVDCVAGAIAIIKQTGTEELAGFNDSGLEYVAKAKKLDPAIPIFWDRLPSTNIDEDIKTAHEHGFETIVMHYSGVTQDKVDKIKAAHIGVGAWTVDDKSTLEKMLQFGVERIYTDDPKLLIEVKQQLNK